MCASHSPQFFWTVSRGRQLLGVNSVNKKYIVGFPNKDIASRVASTLPMKYDDYTKNIRLIRSMHEDVSLDVKRAMAEMQMPLSIVNNNITIDVMARLMIPKVYEQQSIEDTTTINCHEPQQFMLLPFSVGVGIVMPYELESDTSTQYIFTCNVIDPSVSSETRIF